MKIVIYGSDLFAIAVLSWAAIAHSSWWASLILLVVAGWFVRPAWSPKDGWQWRHK